MKAILFASAMFFPALLFAQEVDSLGIDASPLLNQQETALLNGFLANRQGLFDLRGKKVAFVTGGSGNSLLNKQQYFATCVKPWIERGATPRIGVVALTPEEKIKSGGYDAIVLSWVKIFTPRQRARTVKRLASR